MELFRYLKSKQRKPPSFAMLVLIFLGVVFGQSRITVVRAADLFTLSAEGKPALSAMDLPSSRGEAILPADDQQVTTPEPTDGSSNPVQVSTPDLDGSIYHIVMPGENLALIAQAYHISLGDLMALNGLNDDSVIFPNQKLLIRSGVTPTLTPEISDTPTPRPSTPTSGPTRTPTIQPSIEPTITPVSSESIEATTVPPAGFGSDRLGNTMLITIGVLVVLGVGFIITGSLIKRSA